MPRQMPTTPGPRIRAQARGGSLLLTFPIGGRGSRHRRPLPDRPPTLQAFRSVLSETTSVSTQRLSRLPFVPPSPRSSIPESTNMRPYQRVIRQSARSEISCLCVKRHLRFWSRLVSASSSFFFVLDRINSPESSCSMEYGSDRSGDRQKERLPPACPSRCCGWQAERPPPTSCR